MKIFIRSAAAALALSLVGVSGAEAQLTRVSPDCDFIVDVDPDAVGCSGAWDGNFKNQQDDVYAQFEADGWGSYWEYSYGMDLEYEASAGTITFIQPIEKEFILALRSAGQFSLYRFSGAGAPYSAIDWVTNGTSVNKNGIPQGLSGWGVYTVPEPTTLFLLGSGLLAMTGMAWRRRDEILA